MSAWTKTKLLGVEQMEERRLGWMTTWRRWNGYLFDALAVLFNMRAQALHVSIDYRTLLYVLLSKWASEYIRTFVVRKQVSK
jgi:hypothetical protein